MIKNKFIMATIVSSGLFVMTGLAQAANPNTVTFESNVYNVQFDDTFIVNVDGMNFNRTDAGGLNISWDPAILELATVPGVDKVAIDPIWEFLPVPGDTSTPGQVNALLFNTFSFNQPSGNFEIADLAFHAIGFGTTLLVLSESNANPFSGPDGMTGLNFMNTTVNVVPEMETWLMMAAGLGFMSWQAKRQKKVKDKDLMLAV